MRTHCMIVLEYTRCVDEIGCQHGGGLTGSYRALLWLHLHGDVAHEISERRWDVMDVGLTSPQEPLGTQGFLLQWRR